MSENGKKERKTNELVKGWMKERKKERKKERMNEWMDDLNWWNCFTPFFQLSWGSEPEKKPPHYAVTQLQQDLHLWCRDRSQSPPHSQGNHCCVAQTISTFSVFSFLLTAWSLRVPLPAQNLERQWVVGANVNRWRTFSLMVAGSWFSESTSIAPSLPGRDAMSC